MITRNLAAASMRKLLVDATEEAARRGDRRLGTDHLLLALLHGPESRAARALGVSLADARAALAGLDLAALTAVGVRLATAGEPPPVQFGRRLPPLTSGTRAVIKEAVDRAHPRRTGQLGSEHFLLTILGRERPDPAAELLEALGVDPETVRERLARGDGE